MIGVSLTCQALSAVGGVRRRRIRCQQQLCRSPGDKHLVCTGAVRPVSTPPTADKAGKSGKRQSFMGLTPLEYSPSLSPTPLMASLPRRLKQPKQDGPNLAFTEDGVRLGSFLPCARKPIFPRHFDRTYKDRIFIVASDAILDLRLP